MLAKRYRNQPNVIGADLKNEPHGEATWGGGGPTDWRRAAQQRGQRPARRPPDWLIVVEGIGGSARPASSSTAHWWGGNLEGVRNAPVRLRPARPASSTRRTSTGPASSRSRGSRTPNMPALLEQRWRTGFGFIAEQGIAPILDRRVRRPATSTPRAPRAAGSASSSTISAAPGAVLDLLVAEPRLGRHRRRAEGRLDDGPRRQDVKLLRQAIAHRPIAYAAGAGAGSGSGAPAHRPSSSPRQTHRPRHPVPQQLQQPPPAAKPAPPAQPRPAPAPVAPGRLAASVTVQSRWPDGWCGVISVDGPAGPPGRALGRVRPARRRRHHAAVERGPFGDQRPDLGAAAVVGDDRRRPL